MDGLHIDHVIDYHEIAPFHQLDTHLLGEEAVFEVRAVIETGREQHDDGALAAAGRKAAQNPRQFRRVVIHRQHFADFETRAGKSGA